MTAYAFFVQTCREEHKKKHPEESVVFAEFSKKCAERWKVSPCCTSILFRLPLSSFYQSGWRERESGGERAAASRGHLIG
jgi:HMG-box domain